MARKKAVRKKSAIGAPARRMVAPPVGAPPGQAKQGDILWIEMKMRELTNKAIGRYLGRPQDFPAVAGAICDLGIALNFPPSGPVRCTGNWVPCPDNPKVCCPDCPPLVGSGPIL